MGIKMQLNSRCQFDNFYFIIDVTVHLINAVYNLIKQCDSFTDRTFFCAEFFNGNYNVHNVHNKHYPLIFFFCNHPIHYVYKCVSQNEAL